MSFEIEELGIEVSDGALRGIIKNDKLFLKDNKFSRTEYEKFLIKSGVTAPQFEANIVEQEKRRQFLSSLAGGIVIPEVLAEKEFKKENQTKIIHAVKSIHSYAVPCIIFFDIKNGNKDFLKWIKRSVT